MQQEQTHVTPERIMQFAFGYAPTLMIHAAVRHGIFDALDAGRKTIEQVASETGASVRGLRAVMNGLLALGFLTRDGDGRFGLTPDSAAFLVKGKPGYHGALFLHTVDQILDRWRALSDVVMAGKPAWRVNEQDNGAEFFEGFVEALFPMNYPAASALGDALGLAGAGPVSVLDLAAGSGVWGIALAQKSPEVRVTAVDWPGVLPVTRRVVERFGLAGQFAYLAGDIQTVDLGRGHDVATLGHILHSEGEEKSRALLKRVGDSLRPGGTVAIAEMLMNEERTGPPHAAIFAVNMLVATESGDTFTFGEIAGWLRETGFENARLLEVPASSPLILANKAA